jgi:putative nucleotidyltransferase with HDIG domain
MPKSLRIYVGGLVVISVVALIAASLLFAQVPGWVLGLRPELSIVSGSDETGPVLLGLAFWILITLFASASPVRVHGPVISVAIAPIVAVMVLGGPAAAGWVALVGTTEIREIRGKVPWYGTLFNHAGLVLPAIVAGCVLELLRPSNPLLIAEFAVTMIAATVFFLINTTITSAGVAMRDGVSVRTMIVGEFRSSLANLVALSPLAWLMAQVYQMPQGGWWASLLFAAPLYVTRTVYSQIVEMREMFTQTSGALAEAVDKRDPFTSKHSQNVKEIAVDIGREMRVNEAELEALEWGGLLHDVGKIGVPDAVLLKQDRLTRDERIVMNAHPVKGAEIIAPVRKLAPELPIIRHHHEWYNGSGYPDRLIGDEIPKLARILHVADAFEAMTAKRPYRMTPLTPAQALAELRKFAGIQFDPEVVDAFVRTRWVQGVEDAAHEVPVLLKPRQLPFLGDAASKVRQAGDSKAPTPLT